MTGHFLKILHCFENSKGDLEMTARLGKGLHRGSRAEPAHQGVEYINFSENRNFWVEKMPDASPGVLLDARFDF